MGVRYGTDTQALEGMHASTAGLPPALWKPSHPL